MTTQETKCFIAACLQNAKGDDLYRAKSAFKGMTAKEMNEQHGCSGKTRREILNGYMEYEAKIINAIAWVESQP